MVLAVVCTFPLTAEGVCAKTPVGTLMIAERGSFKERLASVGTNARRT
jgi:hypothetical protein